MPAYNNYLKYHEMNDFLVYFGEKDLIDTNIPELFLTGSKH